MSQEASDNKSAIRREMRARLRELSSAEKKNASQDIRAELSQLNLTSCALFAGTATEPDLLPLLEEHPETTLFLPKVISEGEMIFIRVDHKTELKPGAFGILEPEGEPIDPSEIKTIICPGIAFTKEGHRLGQGGGFYDRFLEKAPNAKTIGVGFSFQLIEHLPTESHDAQMEQLILK